jgi:hypothetical protein
MIRAIKVKAIKLLLIAVFAIIQWHLMYSLQFQVLGRQMTGGKMCRWLFLFAGYQIYPLQPFR